MISTLRQLTEHLAAQRERQTVAVVCGHDAQTIEAVGQAIDPGFAKAVLVDTMPDAPERLMAGGRSAHVAHCRANDDAEAAAMAVDLVRQGRADMLMKGLVSTDVLLRAVLNKQQGLLPQGAVLTHVAVAELPAYDKLLLFSDAAVIPYPTPQQRRAQVAALVQTARALGIGEPRLSLIHCSEHVSDKFPHTADYRAIAKEAEDGRWGRVRIDGPLDVRTSLDAATLRVKGITSPIEGRADALLFPDIEAGNTFYKTVTLFGRAKTAGVLCGTTRPVVLPSRGDDAPTKLYSLALAALLSSVAQAGNAAL